MEYLALDLTLVTNISVQGHRSHHFNTSWQVLIYCMGCTTTSCLGVRTTYVDSNITYDHGRTCTLHAYRRPRRSLYYWESEQREAVVLLLRLGASSSLYCDNSDKKITKIRVHMLQNLDFAGVPLA